MAKELKALLSTIATASMIACATLSYTKDLHARASVSETQSQLKQINGKIDILRKTLASANDRRGALNKELSKTEKEIGEGVNQLRSIQQRQHEKQQKIAALQNKINELNKQLTLQQQLLASHVRARYQMGEYQPLKWLIDQETPDKINRLLTYYQYLIKSRQQLITHIAQTKKKIDGNKQQLHSELANNEQLLQQLLSHQQQLNQQKQYHTALLRSLDSEIQNQQHTLQDFEKNKNNLSHLLNTLAKDSAAQNNIPFIKMRKKLPAPVQMAHKTMQKMNQGVTFFAEEGTLVTAVYPGKVVFSDWLKGYGLLLIIDHGQGFMSLYAHNQSLFKHKGDNVSQNEQVASVGHSGGIKQNGLYFEIRLRGKAISPTDWLA